MTHNIQLRVASCQQLSVASNTSSMQLMVAPTKNEQFSKRLNNLLNAMDVPPMNLGRARWFHNYVKNTLKIEVSYEATRKWLSGEAIPYTKRIGSIAKGLNSTTEYLIGEEQGEEHKDCQKVGVNEKRAQYTKEDIDRLNRINKLSPDDQARLDSIINALDSYVDKETG